MTDTGSLSDTIHGQNPNQIKTPEVQISSNQIAGFNTPPHDLIAAKIAAMQIEWALQTTFRAEQARLARWSDIHIKKMVWTVPPHHVKSGQYHSVPITNRMVELLVAMTKIKAAMGYDQNGEFIFGIEHDKPVSIPHTKNLMERIKPSALAYLKTMKSTFTAWVTSEGKFPMELIQAQLGHHPSRAEKVYSRNSNPQKRRQLMEAWATHLTEASNV